MKNLFLSDPQIPVVQACRRGQGVVEYGGALVIAAILVSTVLVLFPDPATNFMTPILEGVADMIEAQSDLSS
ncbi:MAG: hypothetical protein KTR14_02230 [Vampirovibrio sp.]|nr:hypothetical protein [Vampirovibrio sp.]